MTWSLLLILHLRRTYGPKNHAAASHCFHLEMICTALPFVFHLPKLVLLSYLNARRLENVFPNAPEKRSMKQHWWKHNNVSAPMSKTELLDLHPQCVPYKLTWLNKCHATLPTAQDENLEAIFDSFLSRLTPNPSASPLALPSKHILNPVASHPPPHCYLVHFTSGYCNNAVSTLVIITVVFNKETGWFFKNFGHIMSLLSSKPSNCFPSRWG